MKKSHLLCAVMAVGMMTSCSNQLDELNVGSDGDKLEITTSENESLYPVDDGAEPLTGTRAEQMLRLLRKVDPANSLAMYKTQITDEQFQEIKLFTDSLVMGLMTEKEKHEKIFRWICDNIKYEESDNDPYAVFKNRAAICQGYANLLKVMAISQGIPVVSINGMMYNMGHAWTYVYADGIWYMSDPTNGKISVAENLSDYVGYEPSWAELSLFENDDFLFEYNDGRLNVAQVKSNDIVLTVPYSAGGFVVSSFSPSVAMSENIKEVYVGKNIETLGEQGVVGLQLYGQSVEVVHIDPQNPYLESYEGVVYRKEGDTTTPYYIPAHATRIVLKPKKLYGKGVVTGHEYVEEIVFPEGVERISDYAIEGCPNLKRIYVPENTEISRRAFYGMYQDYEVIRGNGETSVPVITMD